MDLQDEDDRAAPPAKPAWTTPQVEVVSVKLTEAGFMFSDDGLVGGAFLGS